jgi:hypothetical protein
MSFTSPSRLASHAKIHAEGYVHGRSDGEARVFNALQAVGVTFAVEVMPPGKRFRFDFSLGPSVFVEYDGMYHFSPCILRPDFLIAYADRVNNDILKSRYCRERGATLCRLTGSVAESAVVTLIQAAVPAPADMSDYVLGHVYMGLLADALRTVQPADMTLYEASKFVASCTALQVCTDDDLDYEQLHAAIVTIFLRECDGASVDEVVEIYGEETLRACAVIVRRMPEFTGFAAPSLVPETAAAAIPVKTLPEGSSGCWVCHIPYASSSKGADTLLQHINARHPECALPVKCSWCSVTFSCHAERLHGEHATDCARPGTGPTTTQFNSQHVSKTAGCGICGGSFGSRARLYAHFNDKHGAKFHALATLRCDTCNRPVSSTAAFLTHACRK